MQINRVESLQYLWMLLDENLYWHEYVDQICASVVRYFGIFNHIKIALQKRLQENFILPLFILEFSMEWKRTEHVRKTH